jgi:putative SOS response-associated peptidase YedK
VRPVRSLIPRSQNRLESARGFLVSNALQHRAVTGSARNLRNEGRNEAMVMKWGLVPPWAPDASMGQRMISARSETLLEKPSQTSRTEKTLPDSGQRFLRMAARGEPKTTDLDSVQDSRAFAFPGLWDCWIDREIGKPLYSFTMVTTHTNALLRSIHDRMPMMHRRDIVGSGSRSR